MSVHGNAIGAVFKICGRCGVAKLPTDYYVNHRNSRHSICKKCKNADSVRSKERHRNRYLARAKVNNALAAGLIVKCPCEACGDEVSQAHHDDYTRPLLIRWLCKTHHDEWHKHSEAKE